MLEGCGGLQRTNIAVSTLGECCGLERTDFLTVSYQWVDSNGLERTHLTVSTLGELWWS